MLKIPILFLIFPECGFLCPSFAFLGENFSTRRFSDNFSTSQNLRERIALNPLSGHDATDF